MKRPTKLGAIWGATLAALAATPALWPMIFFLSADDQSFSGMARAVVVCVLVGGVITLAGSLLGGLIGSLISRFSTE